MKRAFQVFVFLAVPVLAAFSSGCRNCDRCCGRTTRPDPLLMPPVAVHPNPASPIDVPRFETTVPGSDAGVKQVPLIEPPLNQVPVPPRAVNPTAPAPAPKGPALPL